jgi:hypothetical protein
MKRLALLCLLLGCSASAQSKKPTRYVWYGGPTTDSLTAQLRRAGPAPRLELRDSAGGLWLHVIPTDPGEAVRAGAVPGFTPLNKSHPCPPDCP